jgi:hypothetical protein
MVAAIQEQLPTYITIEFIKNPESCLFWANKDGRRRRFDITIERNLPVHEQLDMVHRAIEQMAGEPGWTVAPWDWMRSGCEF